MGILESLDGVDENKVQNFEKVVKIIENIEIDRSEKKILSDLVDMFEKTEECFQESEGMEKIKSEKFEEIEKKSDRNPSDELEIQKSKTDIVIPNESQTTLTENIENKPVSNFDMKKELDEAVEEMLKAAAEVREGFRLNNPPP